MIEARIRGLDRVCAGLAMTRLWPPLPDLGTQIFADGESILVLLQSPGLG